MQPDQAQPEFRLATPADAELVLDFMHDYYAFDGHPYHRKQAGRALLVLLTNPALGMVWLILDSATPVGYVVLCFGYSLEFHGRDAFIDELYLVESHRRRGWGTKTMEFVGAQAGRQGIRALHLEVVRRNQAALEFYRKLGFAEREHFMMTLPLPPLA